MAAPGAPSSVARPPSSKRRAWGVAVGYKNTGLGGGAPDKSAAEVELYSDGTAEVRTSAAEIRSSAWITRCSRSAEIRYSG